MRLAQLPSPLTPEPSCVCSSDRYPLNSRSDWPAFGPGGMPGQSCYQGKHNVYKIAQLAKVRICNLKISRLFLASLEFSLDTAGSLASFFELLAWFLDHHGKNMEVRTSE